MRKLKLISVSCVLAVIASMFGGVAVSAEDPDGDSTPVTPKIEVNEKDWLIIGFGEEVKDKVAVAQQLDAYLVNALAEMVSAGGGGGFMLDGYQSMGDSDTDSGPNGGYVSGSFSTYASWASEANLWGTSSSAWYGTNPYNAATIDVEHQLSWDGNATHIAHPAGWYWNELAPRFTNGYYQTQNYWYLGTSWSGLRLGLSLYDSASVAQNTTSTFVFGAQYDPPASQVSPSNSMYVGPQE